MTAGTSASVVFAMVLGGCGSDAPSVLPVPADSVVGSTFVEVSGAFVRRVADTMELYFSLTNHATGNDRVVAVTVPAARSVTVLGVAGACDNDSTDVRAAASIEVPAEDSVVLRPDGCRVVLDGVATDASSIAVTLTLAGGLNLAFDVPVKGV